MTSNDGVEMAPELSQPRLLALTFRSLKRTYDLFQGELNEPIPMDEASQKVKMAVKVLAEYAHVKDMPAPAPARPAPQQEGGPEPKKARKDGGINFLLLFTLQ